MRKACLTAIAAAHLSLIAAPTHAADYYVSPAGSDSASGSSTAPWRSIAKVNATVLRPGDRVFFQGGQRFAGKISLDASDGGSATAPVLISSYGSGRALIDGGAGDALIAYNCAGFDIRSIDFVGAGTAGNSGAGINFYTDLANGAKLAHVRIDSVDCSGFRYGVILGGWAPAKPGFVDVQVTNVRCHDNARAGFCAYGYTDPASTTWCHRDWYIGHCRFDRNLGDPAFTTNHSGSGIVIADVDNAVIERCVANGNGPLNHYPYAGPVGIWAYEANRVTIQYCESYDNHTCAGSVDGDGFDFDGGTSNSVMQYNYSHGNDSAGYLVCEFGGARPTHDNVFRYNVSENDCRTVDGGGLFVWLGSRTRFHGNTVYCAANGRAPMALRVAGGSGTVADDNLFVTTGGVRLADVTGDTVLLGNGWWPSGSAFTVVSGGATCVSLAAMHAIGLERWNGVDVGRSADPLLTAPGAGGILASIDDLSALSAYRLRAGSPMIDAGVDPRAAVGLDPGARDFYGDALPQGAAFDIGAHEAAGSTPPPPNQPPVAAISASATSGVAPATMTFSGAGSSDPDGSLATWDWSFGDGGTASGVSVSHTYAAAGSYPVTLTVRDQLGAAATASIAIAVSAPPTAPQPPPAGGGTGSIARQWWLGVAGVAVGDLTGSPAYPAAPSGSDEPTLFEAPTDWADNYGTRMRGYVTAPVAGGYVFTIAGDDQCQLFLSVSGDPAQKTLIASVPGWTASREWGKYPEQRSAVIQLAAGQRCYIEALHKEGAGGDNLAVAWQFPNGAVEAPIPGHRLTPYADPAQPPPQPPVAGNLVVDPGFEAGLAAWGDAGGTTAAAGAGPDGSTALRIGPGAGGRFQDLVGARPSTTYSLAAWGRVSNRKERGIICVDVTDGSGATRRSTLDVNDRRWLEKSLQFTTPADLRGIRVWVWKDVGSADYLFVDQVRVIAAEPAAPAGSG